MTGNRGKFGERLKRIVFFRRNKNTKSVDNNIQIEDSNKIYINFLKVMAAIPGLVYGNLTSNESKEKSNNEVNTAITTSNLIKPSILDNRHRLKNNLNNKSTSKNISDFGDNKIDHTHNVAVNEVSINQGNIDNNASFSKIEESKNAINDDISFKKNEMNKDRDIKRKKIIDISISEIKDKQDKYFKNQSLGIKIANVKDNIMQQKNNDNKVKQLEKSIINLIKKDLIKVVNELEILQSELYILSEVNGESKELVECQRELDQVKSMLCKIDKLKEQYEFLKDNYDFEYLLEIDNKDLVDKIIELKDTFGNNELKAVSEDYKLLDVYKYLYLKIDDLQEKTALFEEKKNQEAEKLKARDIDFESLKRDVYNVGNVNATYQLFVNNQNDLLKEIDANVSKIDSYEQVDYHLKGFSEIFRNTFKYFGLLMVSPLKGIIPSIATETLITGNLIKNLYKKLEWEETRTMVYEAIDYSRLISNAINDLESTSNIVDMTLDDIVHLKMKYNEQFKKYQGDFLEYREIMQKINDMENKILGNKIKIEMMKKRALEQQKANEKKLKLVKELNEKK